MVPKKITIQGVGNVTLERSRRAKHIRLSVKPFHGARVAVPHGVSYQEAIMAARSKTEWLRKNTRKMALIERQVSHFEQTEPIDRGRARQFLVQRLEALASVNGFVYNRVFIRNQKTLWGSCSHRNNINLNVNLVRLRGGLIDYTILHELVHTRIKNHSQRFWEELGKYIGDPKSLDRELNQYWPMLLARAHP